MLGMCRGYVFLLVFFFRMDVEGMRLHDFYNHITLIAVLVGPLTLMTCGMLVLSTLLDEVSTCTNRWEGHSMHYG